MLGHAKGASARGSVADPVKKNSRRPSSPSQDRPECGAPLPLKFTDTRWVTNRWVTTQRYCRSKARTNGRCKTHSDTVIGG